jgi:hypothetical protein
MQSVATTSLFTDLSSEEAANVNGARYNNFYYYNPQSTVSNWGTSFVPCQSWGWSGGSNPGVSQTVNVNVQIKD